MLDLIPDTRLVAARIKLERARNLEDERPDEALALYGDIIAELGMVAGSAARKRLAEALFFKSQMLIEAGHVEEGLTLIGEMADRFGDDRPPLRRRVAHALWCTVVSFRPDGTEAALALCAEGRHRFAHDTDSCVLDRLLSLFVEEGLILERLGRVEDGRVLRDMLIARFEGVADMPIRDRAGHVADQLGATFA